MVGLRDRMAPIAHAGTRWRMQRRSKAHAGWLAYGKRFCDGAHTRLSLSGSFKDSPKKSSSVSYAGSFKDSPKKSSSLSFKGSPKISSSPSFKGSPKISSSPSYGGDQHMLLSGFQVVEELLVAVVV